MPNTSLAIKPVPLAQAMADLAAAMAYLDEHEGEVPDDVIPALHGTVAAVSAAVDRRIGLLRALKAAKDLLRDEKERLKKNELKLEALDSKIKESTKTAMQAFGCLKLEGTVGRFQICTAGGNQAVQFNFNTTDIDNVLSDETAALVPQQYVSEVSVKVVDVKRLLDDVRKGIFLSQSTNNDDGSVSCAYATLLPRGSYIRIF